MKRALHIALSLMPLLAFSQTEFIINNGTDVRINPGCQVIFANGGMQNAAGQLSNAGELVVEGSLLNNGALIGGASSGIFRILNDVENNGQMQPGQSEFELYGDDQFLRGTQQLNFYDLTLVGGGVKYMLQNISTVGTLNLTDRELAAASNTIYHSNSTPATVLAVHDQGFVSANAGGGLSRTTNTTADYYFPVGSAQNGLKIRPITVAPNAGGSTYKVRFVNGPTPFSVQRGIELYYVNPIFYHEVQRTEGTSPGTLTVFYEEVEDGFFQTLAHLESDFWRENVGTGEGPLFGTGPELKSFETPDWDFPSTEIALAALSTELFVPNVFSPNDDGHNDVFKPRGTNLFGYQLRIYDRWGNKVFESDDIEEGWDGTFNGKLMNSAVFVYYILSGDEVVSKGNVTLVR
jgi:gliding motility-associated-like protein